MDFPSDVDIYRSLYKCYNMLSSYNFVTFFLNDHVIYGNSDKGKWTNWSSSTDYKDQN